MHPTVYGPNGLRLLEAHILGLNGDLCGSTIEIALVHMILLQTPFASFEELVEALTSHIVDTSHVLGRLEIPTTTP
jgi:FAD synthase